MKKIYNLSLCALIGASSVTASSRFKTRRGNHQKLEESSESPAPVMRPQSIREFMFIEGAWQDLGSTRYTYDARGNSILQIVEDGGAQLRIASEFNEYDMPVAITTSVNEGSGWRQDSKRTYVYDPVLHNYFIERMGFDWDGSSWKSNYYCETNTITRNDDGCITEIVKSLPFSGDMVPAYKSAWNYDSTTGKANEFRYYPVSYTHLTLPTNSRV